MDPRTILNTLKEASPFDIFLISFLLLPFVFDAWLDVMERIGFGESGFIISLIIILIGYSTGVIATLVGSSRQRSREIARDQIMEYLTRKNFVMVSYERIRKNINQAYGDNFLETLHVHFPDQLRKAKLKGNKKGLARIIEADVDDEA